MAIEIKEITDKNEWEEFILSQPCANFLHSWYWGEFHQAIKRQIIRHGYFIDGKLVGVMLFIIENAKRGRHGIVPAGPIIDWENKSLIKAVFKDIKDVAAKNKCIFVRIRPQIIDSKQSRQIFKDNGLRPAPIHLHAELTWQTDLNSSEEEILANTRKNTRYEIRRADKLGITVKTTTDPASIDRFYDIQLETAKRHGFVPFSKSFLKEQFTIFAKNNLALLYEAYDHDTLLAQAFIIFYGQEAVYHYGTGTDAGRNLPGAYALQWQAMKEAKKRGMSRYNFWGVTKPEQTKHRFYGVSVFKRGFCGQEVAYLHAHDLVINRSGYLFNLAIELARKYVRHI